MEIDKELRRAERTGKVAFGSKEVLKSLKREEAKLILLTPNCSNSVINDIKKNAKINETQIHNYKGTSEDLGLAFGKPFLVSAAAIIDSGNSQILRIGGVTSENQT
ncbi:MAG: 50S ribosomal protein L30e [Hadesarchaea archaeon]|nr:50S ribosomal protein L30e [Hadesarchaea archaeon]